MDFLREVWAMFLTWKKNATSDGRLLQTSLPTGLNLLKSWCSAFVLRPLGSSTVPGTRLLHVYPICIILPEAIILDWLFHKLFLPCFYSRLAAHSQLWLRIDCHQLPLQKSAVISSIGWRENEGVADAYTRMLRWGICETNVQKFCYKNIYGFLLFVGIWWCRRYFYFTCALYARQLYGL